MAAAELTAANMDRSAVLEELIAGEYGSDESALLGELQAHAVTFYDVFLKSQTN